MSVYRSNWKFLQLELKRETHFKTSKSAPAETARLADTLDM